ncbi:MAG: zinc-ribbon domain-containing protein [Clostridiaceae bacterium]|jgi:hypothetical protein|nr:zinc-ribbon domain-containing protein [Clostridiaceae bacterium]
MFCSQCGNPNDDKARFCSSCGNPLATPKPEVAQETMTAMPEDTQMPEPMEAAVPETAPMADPPPPPEPEAPPAYEPAPQQFYAPQQAAYPAQAPQQPAYPQYPYPQQAAYGQPMPQAARPPSKNLKIGLFAGLGALVLIVAIVLVVVLTRGGGLTGVWEVVEAPSWSDFVDFKDERLYLQFKSNGVVDIVVHKDHPQRERYEQLAKENEGRLVYEVEGNMLRIGQQGYDGSVETYRFEKQGRYLQIYDYDNDLAAILARR